jgi:radical SAM protein with 4Fe4S-binding SPASM domain
MANPMVQYNKRKIVSSSYPREINLETTNFCNLRCISCPQRGEMTRKKGFMKMDLFKKIINESSGNVRNIQLHLFGEPLLHPDIIPQLVYAKKKGIALSIFTNGALLNEKLSKALSKYAERVVISFNGATKETYEKIQKGSNFEKTMKQIAAFLSYVKKHKGCNVKLKFLQMGENEKEAKDFLKQWGHYRARNINVTVVKEHDWAGQLSNLPSWEEHLKKRYPCFLLWKAMAIGWNGDVGLCCYDFNFPYIVGNLNKQTIKEVWNGPEQRRIREIHLSGNTKKLSLCKNCTSWTLYPRKFSKRHILKSSVYTNFYGLINKIAKSNIA